MVSGVGVGVDVDVDGDLDVDGVDVEDVVDVDCMEGVDGVEGIGEDMEGDLIDETRDNKLFPRLFGVPDPLAPLFALDTFFPRSSINSLANEMQVLSNGLDMNSSQPASMQVLRCDSRGSAIE